jgi:two-component system, NarL family, invasion response regulator UvrY
MNIIVADDHEVVREGLKQILSTIPGITQINSVSTGAELVELIKVNDYDIAILDISMPGKNGIEVLKEIKALKPELPVLMLSMYSEKQYAVRVLKAGASGYLTKDTASEELITAVEKIAGGRKYIPPDLAEKLAEEVSLESDKLLHEYLSDREFEVFRLMAGGKTVKEIADELLLSPKTVSTYRARIYEKMKFKSRAELTAYAIRNKLLE